MPSRAPINRLSLWRRLANTSLLQSLERRSNRLANLLRGRGLARLDHYAIFMENNARYVECCAAGARSGLYFTCVNSYLTVEELAYIVDNSQSKVLDLFDSPTRCGARRAGKCPRVELCLLVDGPGDGGRVLNLDQAVAGFPDTPVAEELLGTAMLYSSGTTGRPKVRRGRCPSFRRRQSCLFSSS